MRAVGRSIDRVGYAARAAGAVAAQPYEGLERIVERVVAEPERRWRSWRYLPTHDAERRLHGLLGAPWPCGATREFDELWPALTERLRARGGRVGRAAYGGWDDADRGFARAAWCLTRHLRPLVVVETGVARGVTSSLMLEGLERNGTGRLWSVDLAPLAETGLSEQTAWAVGEEQRERWTLLKGSSRRLLRGLVAGLPDVGLFVHDSMHTTRNVRFELGVAWPALAPGGVALVDDVEQNRAFAAFTATHRDAQAVVFRADDGRALFGCLVKAARGAARPAPAA